jgi:hypothetical protein
VTDAGLQTVDGLAGTTQRIYQIRRFFVSLPLPPMMDGALIPVGRILARVNPKLPPGSTCEQCEKVAQELQDAWTSDLQELRTRLEDVALSSGRDPLKLGNSSGGVSLRQQ